MFLLKKLTANFKKSHETQSSFYLSCFNSYKCFILQKKDRDPVPPDNGTAYVMDTILMASTQSAPLFENSLTSPLPDYTEVFVGRWSHGGTYYKHRFILKLDLSTIPQRAVIDSAFIIFSGTDNATSSNVSTGQYNNYGDNAMFLEKVTAAWDKQTVDWSNQPLTTTENRVNVANTGNTNNGSGKIHINSFVQNWVSTPANNFGMIFKLQDETTDQLRRVHSESTHLPHVKVYYRTN
ncbi:MAG: hypothetical protein JWO58_2138 [Chitinophagaceae bacterium]|nr:hypothetical protein [Chitinophagaceae bacterium]